MTEAERFQEWCNAHPDEIALAVKEWRETPRADLALAWLANEAGIFEVPDSNDPADLAADKGRRELFWVLVDMSSIRRNDILTLRERLNLGESME